MKRVILVCLLLSTFVLARPTISGSEGKDKNGYQWVNYEALGAQVATPSYSITWRASDIAGFAGISIEGMSASAGNSTTVNAMPLFANGKDMTGEDVVITAGTDITDFKSPNYRFTYYSVQTTTTNVTFNFLIAD